MKYFNLLQPQEKDFINSLQSELGFTLENEFQKDFAAIKSALKDKFNPLKNSEDTTNLGIVLAQVKKAKEIQEYLQNAEDQLLQNRDEYVQNIEQEFANW